MYDYKQNIYCKIYIFIIYLLICSTIVLSKTKCKTHRDCNQNDEIICSVCVDDVSDKKAYCVFPFTYMFETDTCIRKTKCDNDCNNQGTCINEIDLLPFCICKRSFYGSTCESKVVKPTHALEKIKMNFIIEVKSNKYAYQLLRFSYIDVPGYDMLTNSQVILNTYDGYFTRYLFKQLRRSSKISNTGNNIFNIDKKMDLIFPFRELNREGDEALLTRGDRLIGFIGLYTIRVIMFGRESYLKRLTIFVSYEDHFLKCIPLIKLLNCGSSGFSPSIIMRSTPFEIDSSVTFLEDGAYLSTAKSKPECGNSATYTWISINYNNVYGFGDYKHTYNHKVLSHNAYSLEFGLQRVQLTVSVVMADGTTINNAFCYFKVVSSPLVALIDGSSHMKGLKKYGLKLSADKSRDPNMAPSQQGHVYLEWSCVREDKPGLQDEVCRARRFGVKEVYRVRAEQLDYGAVYNFTLKVGVESIKEYELCDDCDMQPRYDYVKVEIGAENDTTPLIIVKCALNCRQLVTVNRKTFLKAYVEYESQNNYTFKWTYLKVGDKNEQPVDNIVVKGLPSYMLLVKENTLEEGASYVITTTVNGTNWFAKYQFDTDKMIYDGTCDIQPTSGVKGETDFNINCTLFQNYSLTYEFYDKTENEAKDNSIFNGRMLGTSNSGHLWKVRLTRGNVCVYIMNTAGLNKKRVILVKLTDLTVTGDVMRVIQQNLTEILYQGDIPKTLEFISFIPDIVPPHEKHKVFGTLLNVITPLHVYDLANVKLCASTLSNVLFTLNQPKPILMKANLMDSTLRMINRMTFILSDKVHDREQSQYTSPNEIGFVATALLNCLQATLMSNDTKIKNLGEDDLDLPVLYKLKSVAESTENIIDQVKNIMTYLQAPGQPPTKLASQNDYFVVCVMKNDEGFRLQQLIDMEKIVPITIPILLQTRLEQKNRFQDQLALQVSTIKENIYWWKVSDVKSNLASITLAKQVKESKLIKVKDVSPKMGMMFKMPDNLNSTTIKNSVIQPNPNLDPNILDMAVKIHRLDPAPGSFISITFLYPQTNNSLIALLMADFMPDYEMIKTSSQTVSITSNSNVYPYIHRHREEPTFFYLGILPGPNVLINDIVSYEFIVNTTLCQFWVSGQWSSLGCQVGKDTKGREVHCECSHLSIFAAAFPVPPQDIDLFADAKLFLTVLDNPLVVAAVSSVLLLYIIICLFILYKDRGEKYKKTVIILEDNFPDDRVPYLVAVYTSSRFNAGTTANIGLRLIGESSNSRVHVLKCRYRKVLRKNTDDWFLLLCPNSLGKIKSIHIWHDNAGSSPDWFCEKIFVYDLQENVETLFVVEQWLALRLNAYPEAKLVPAGSHEVMNVKRLFLENFVLGLMEGHILLSIFLRHPRSDVSRLQRVSVFMACFMTAMLTSIMFYKPNSDDRTGVDDFQYSIGYRELIISFQCLLINGIVAFIILFCFKKCSKHKYTQTRSTLRLRDDELPGTETQDLHHTQQAKEKKSLYKYFVKSVTRMMKSQPFVPVQMSDGESVVKIRKSWFVIAWTICIVVIVLSSYMIMLYGLKMGPVNSWKWLSAVGLTVSEDIFVTGPARIIFFAIILSMAFQRMFVVNTHRVKLTDVLSLPPQGDEYYMKLLARRNHPMYAPLKEAARKEMLRKQDNWKKWWTFIDFTISIGFVVVVSVVISLLWSSHYYATSHVRDMITSTRVPYLTSIDFFKVKSITDMNSYLQNSMTLALFQKAWYNGVSIDKVKARLNYWAADHVGKMIGLPIVRQLRANSGTCENIILSRGKCLLDWTSSNEDTDEYGPKWSVASWDDVAKNVSAWKYTTRDSIPIMLIIFNRMYGATGILYDTSGYLVTLGPRRGDAEATLTELRLNDWQDSRTRVLFVELTLYNPNRRLFSQTTLIAEYLLSGTILLKANVETIDANVNLGFWSPVFVGFIIWYLFRTCYLINKMGLLEYLFGFNNVCRIVVVVVGFITIAICVIHLYYSTQYFRGFLVSGLGTYFDFDRYSYYFVLTKIMLSILISIAFLRMILFIRFGRLLLSQYYTFLITLSWTLWLTLIVIGLVVVLKQVAYLINIFKMARVKELVIEKKAMLNLANEDFQRAEVQIFLFLKTVLISVPLSLFVIIFLHFSKLARGYKVKESDKFNYFTFISNQLNPRKKKKEL